MNFRVNLLKKSIILLVLILVATTAFASNGETINIGGTVPLLLNLTVTADTAADNLTLTTTGADASTTVPIASIDISTNNYMGWELWVFSTNDAKLNNSDGRSIGYTLTYAGTGGGTAAAPTSGGVKFGEAGAATTETGEAMNITYTQSATHPAGYYSDQLTIVLRAK